MKTKNRTIEKITYKSGNQAICHREIYEYNNLKIKIEIKSDSYRQQCHAIASVLDGLQWNIIYTIPACEMNTKESLVYNHQYKNDAKAAEAEFKIDVQRIKKYISELL